MRQSRNCSKGQKVINVTRNQGTNFTEFTAESEVHARFQNTVIGKRFAGLFLESLARKGGYRVVDADGTVLVGDDIA